jgi:hypothetical protein
MRTVSVLVSLVLLIPDPAWACRSGVADGEVTVDGRSIAWKVRMLDWQRNHLVYKRVGDTTCNPDGSVAGVVQYAYVAMIDPNPNKAIPPGNEVRQGLNTAGLSCSHNAKGQNWGWPNSHFLANMTGISEVHDYIENTGITKGSFYFLNDAGSNAALWELHESAVRSDGKGRQRFRYATTSPTRDAQYITISGGTENGRVVTRSGFAARANTGHYSGNGNTSCGDGADTPGTTEYVTNQIARNKAALQYSDHCASLYGSLTVKTLFQGMIAHRGVIDEYDFVREFSPATTVGATAVHGVLPGEDPRLSTMWTALGHTNFSITVPVWAVVTDLPDTMDNQNNGCFADIVGGNNSGGGLYNSGLGAAHVQARSLPMESKFFDTVLCELLPYWRTQDWSNVATTVKITDEMTRVENQMSADAYSLLERMLNGDPNNYAPLGSGISDYIAEGRTVKFTGMETDSDGAIVSRSWNYGDGQRPDALGLHTYLQAGTYLVSFTVTDDDDVTYTDWEFVTVM